MNYYSSYGPRIEKEEVSRTHAISTESKSEEYLEVEVSTNLTTGVQKTISFKNVYDGKIVIQKWHLLLIVVFIACSFLISLSLLLFLRASEFQRQRYSTKMLRKIMQNSERNLQNLCTELRRVTPRCY